MRDYAELASGINKAIGMSARQVSESIASTAATDKWTAEKKLSALLFTTYSAQVVMLELRNEVWPYEYMAFSRRIGELWEVFVRTIFDNAPTGIRYFVPPLFSEVRSELKKEISVYISKLKLSKKEKDGLLAYYDKVWVLVDSGEISLQLDLHFLSGKNRVNVDLKSGFGSNEKGNTNRLLMVATIYKNLSPEYKNVLLVRSEEDKNNHYFRTLKNSGVWTASCGKDAYDQIQAFTGFDASKWIEKNIDWMNDLSKPTSQHLQKNKLVDYLSW